MKDTCDLGGNRFRVWIAQYEHGQPAGYGGVPPGAVAVEPAEEGTMSGEEAATYVEAFNRAAVGRSGKLWAVALPVVVRYRGEPRPGQTIEVDAGLFPPAPTGQLASAAAASGVPQPSRLTCPPQGRHGRGKS